MDDAPHDDETTGLTVEEPSTWAAGVPAVRHALEYSLEQTTVPRTARTLLTMNQVDGIDCPGCAWPDPEVGHRSRNEYCENGAKHINDEATRRRVTPEFFRAHPVDDLASRSDRWLNQQGRLTEPMVKRPGSDHYEPIGWNEAFALVADELRSLDSPDQASFYTSGRVSNEAAFLFQLFARAYGTNNLPDCSNMCHESSGFALHETLGTGKGSVSLLDLENADLIFLVGQNPGSNHPRQLSALEAAKLNGARIVAVNPLPEAGLRRFKNPQKPRGVVGRGTEIADRLLQVRPGGDLALFQALNRMLLEAEDRAPGTVLDRDFIESSTDGFDAFAEHVRGVDLAEVLEETGLTLDEIGAVHEDVLQSDRVVVCWAMGLTQQRHAVPTIREIVNFLLLRGNVGRPGTGPCPVRGHSNVQGDRTMGIWEQRPDAFLDSLRVEFGFEPPREQGVDAVGTIRAMRDGEVSVFFGLAGNFVRAAPDSEATEAALRRCRLTVQVSTKLNRSHAVCGETALILPALGRTELDVQDSGPQFLTVEDSMSQVHTTRGRLTPASPHLLSEVAIVCRLARATLDGSQAIPWTDFEADYGHVRDRISRIVPGFHDYDRRVTRPGGFTLPNPVNEGVFPTETGAARFTTNRGRATRAPAGHLVLQTLRSHDQWNTVPYTDNDRYRGIHGSRQVVMVNREDLLDLGLSDGDTVDVVGVWDDGVDRRASGFTVVAYPTPRGGAAAYYPETNVLVPLDSVAETSNQPTYKDVVVRLEKVGSRPVRAPEGSTA